MIKKKKKYEKPRKRFEKARIKEENLLLKKYGLKNKKEIWKTDAKIKYFRRMAKKLAKKDEASKEKFFQKLNLIGLKVDSISDVLSLRIEDLLERRLPTIVFKRGLAKTVKQARQFVTHKKVMVGERVINIPSYLVKVAEEDTIKLRKIEIKDKGENEK